MPTNLPSEADRPLPAHVPAEPASLSYRQPIDVEAPESGGFDLRRYLAVAKRYKWLILTVMLVGTAAGYGASRFVKPLYLAQAMIWIEVTQRGEAAQGPIRSGQLLQSYAWLDLLKSFYVLDPVVREQRLYLSPQSPGAREALETFTLKEQFRPGEYVLAVDEGGRRLRLSTKEGVVLQDAVIGDSIGQTAGFAWVPPASALEPGKKIAFAVRPPRDISSQLAQTIDTRMVQEGNFLGLELEGTDPERIASTLNAVADRYVDVAAELKGVKLTELVGILNEQLLYAEQNLREAETELESFRINTITLPTERATPVSPGLAETRDPVFDNYFNMKIEQEQLRRDREAIQSALSQLGDSSRTVTSLEYVEAVRNSSELATALQELTNKKVELRTLRSKYTDEYPTVHRLIEEIRTLEQQTVPQLASGVIEQLAARDAQIDGLIGSASSELQRIPPRQLEEMRLQRRVAIADNLYTDLRQRYEAARLAAASSIPDIRVLDHAMVPERPVEDERYRIILMAFAGSLGLGLLGAILLDRFDPRLRYPEQVTQDLRLSILGAVPFIQNRNGKLHSQNTAQVVEAFRELRLSLVHAHGTAGPLVTTFTSPGSGDGKSFVTSNLALAFADLGHRTILIDGDIRRGGQHRLFGKSRKPGLTDYLVGNASLEDVVQETSYPALHLIGCGTRLQGGPELLGSPVMVDLMKELRARYSVILIDSPPLGAGVDPFILGTLSGSMVLILRTGYTDREFAESKLDMLDRLPIRILGAVLNAVPPHGVYRYYSYLPGYEAREEVEVAARQLPGA